MNSVARALIMAIARLHYDHNALAYHNWDHVLDLLAVGAIVEGELRTSTVLAVVFHDAVYDPNDPPGYNEANSVELLDKALAVRPSREGLSESTIDEARRMIHATAHHMKPDLPVTMLPTENVLRFMDLDMSILGKPWDAFLAYRKAIRKEHAKLPLDVWKAGSVAFCRTLLERDSIYRTEPYRALFETTARSNLTQYLSTLEP